MEEDKKRKGKKKKNKQRKTVGDGMTAVGETTPWDQNLVNHGKGDENSQLMEAAAVQSRYVVDSNGHVSNGKECVISEEKIKKLKEENDMHVKKEAILEEKIRKLKEENDTHIQKEAISEEMLRKLKDENDMHVQREAMSEETVRQLREQSEMCIQKEVNFEETINQLRGENELQMQKQACMEMRMAQLQSEKDSLIQKEAGLDEKVNQLLNEKSNLSQLVESLEERIKLLEGDLSSSMEKENSAKETILNMNADISRLQVQLAELEESSNNLLLENQRLMGNVSSLHLAIQNLEKSRSSSRSVDASAKDNVSEHEDSKNQIESTGMHVEKLVEENSGLDEKPTQVNEYAEPASVAIPIPESEEVTSVSAQKLESSEDFRDQDKNDTIDAKDVAGVVSDSRVSDGSGEIVQIPLDDNEVRDQEVFEDAKKLEKDAVPLTDAPLIGAPFRLISFVAKYVSGADLVNKSSSDASH